MIVECLNRREGKTPVFLDGVQYDFWPIPGTRKGEMSTSICEISNEKHLAWFIRQSNLYREYDPEKSLAEMRMQNEKKNPMAGYAIQKYLDSGYIVADYRDPKKSKFAGADGKWVDERRNMSPFASEMQAWEFLKSEVEYSGMDDGPEETPETRVDQPIPEKRGPGRPVTREKSKADETLNKMGL